MHAAYVSYQDASGTPTSPWRAPRRATLESLTEAPAESSSVTSTLVFPQFRRTRVAFEVVLRSGQRNYALRDGLALEVEHTPDGHVFVRHAHLEITGEARNAVDALDDFAMMFDTQYRALVETDPARLTRYALKLRERFERAVAKVDER